jgi:hypothetical protein
MPGLGTALLPLAKKHVQGTHPSPPKDSPSTGSNSGSQGSFDITQHPYAEFAAVPPQAQQPESKPWALDVRMQDSAGNLIPTTMLPQDLMHPTTYVQPTVPWTSKSTLYGNGHNTGRPYSRAQSFDDFLRLHRLQDHGVATLQGPALSEPLGTTSLPPYAHQTYPTEPQAVHQNVVPAESQTQENLWGTRNFGHGPLFQFPMLPVHPEPSDGGERQHDGMMAANWMEDVHFSSITMGQEQVDYDPAVYNVQDMSWQMFMDGLGL